jgi:hypothetical protein
LQLGAVLPDRQRAQPFAGDLVCDLLAHLLHAHQL